MGSRKNVLIKVLSAGTTMKNYSSMSHKKVKNIIDTCMLLSLKVLIIGNFCS